MQRIGVVLPTSGPLPLRLGVDAMAQAAVDAGAADRWVGDNLVLPRQTITEYPSSADCQLAWNPDRDYLEALSTLAYLAGAVRSDCTLGTAVLVLPQRNALQMAKEIATIDQLAGGRLQLGVGAGWNRAEMAALGFDFTTRAQRFDGMLEVPRDAWNGRTSGYTGTKVVVPADLGLRPPSARPGGPPLLIGGLPRAALRRVARLGDGWLALSAVETWDPERLRAGLGELRAVWAATGREGCPRAVLKLHCADGTAELLRPCLSAAAQLGFDEVAVELPWRFGIDAAAAVTAQLTGPTD